MKNVLSQNGFKILQSYILLIMLHSQTELEHGKKKCDSVFESYRICNLVPLGAIPIKIWKLFFFTFFPIFCSPEKFGFSF